MSEARTEPATPKKLRRARERGEVWRSPALTSAAIFLAAAAALSWLGPPAFERLRGFLAESLRAACSTTPPTPAGALEAGLDVAVACLAPIVLILFVAAVAIELLQVRPLFTLRPLSARGARLDVVSGLRRLLDGRGLGALGFALLQVLVVGVVFLSTMTTNLRPLLMMVHASPAIVADAAGGFLVGLLWRGSVALLALAALDVLRQRRLFQKDQRMTRREVEREHREAEGDSSMAARRWLVFRELVTDVARGRGRGRVRSG